VKNVAINQKNINGRYVAKMRTIVDAERHT
jgi:hypothetical protein